MGRSAPQAPALPRLEQAIAGEVEAEALAAREARLEEEAKARNVAEADAAKAAATRDTATAPSPSPPLHVAPARVAASPVPPPSRSPSPAPPPAAPAEATPTPALVHAAAPRYPMIAMHRGVEGRVEVAFTVQADGSVANARVRSAQPEGVFENAALDAVADYRFAPGAEAQDIVQTIHFRLPKQG